MSERRELLIGAGFQRNKILSIPDRGEWSNLTTLDINPESMPDVVWDLNNRPLPFEDNSFDEIHAYEVMEHLGKQGDWCSFFEEWSEWYRILKPDGILFGTSPHWSSAWAWGDPGHTRIIQPESFVYLSQRQYAQVGQTAMTDYRFVYHADFEVAYHEIRDETFVYALQTIKPSRYFAITAKEEAA